MGKIAIIVHGGAGRWDRRADFLDEAMLACEEAAAVGQALLLAGRSALDAIEAAVHVLENCPVLDAGVGSYPNSSGEVEMDAIIMDGATLESGAVGAVQRVRHPVSLARLVMEKTAHSFFVGEGASMLADEMGFERCSADSLISTINPASAPELSDTVGAVAIDCDGNLAVATSTGGTRDKMPGRVGDSPLIGCGAYADNESGAASATGHGESFMKIIASARVCDAIVTGLDAQQACEATIELLQRRTTGTGGLIAVDRLGRVGAAYNTQAMPHAYAVGDEPVVVNC